MKLSSRLQFLAGLIDPDNCAQIWDMCCDHAKLAIQLKENFKDSKIYAVDVVDSGLLYKGTEIKFIKEDAALIDTITPHSTVIIAGVGADTIDSILRSLLKLNNCSQVNFIVSTHSKELVMRENLTSMGFKLIRESLIKDNSQFYDILHISTGGSSKIPQIGEFEGSDRDIKIEYYQKLSRYLKLKRDRDYSLLISELTEKIIRLR